MNRFRVGTIARRPALGLPLLLIALSACATAGSRRTAAGGEPDGAARPGPGARVWTTDDFGAGDRIRTAFRLDDDAYVAVVNVGLDGYARMIFPESPDDDGFMRGGRTYRLPSFFPGFATHFRATRFGRLHHATAAYDGIYDRYAGYVFIVASWRPMHFDVAEAVGLWDDHRLAAHEHQLEPYTVMHRLAAQLVGGSTRDYTAHFARYAAYRSGFGRAGAFASCTSYGLSWGYVPWWRLHSGGLWAQGYGYGPRCGPRYRYAPGLAVSRPYGRPVVRPPTAAPPAAPDPAAPPRRPRRPRREVVASDSGERRPRGVHRQAPREEPVIDVTRETRELARRRDHRGESIDRAGGRGAYRRPVDWGGAESPRARADDDRRARGESSRRDSRAGEPRREPPPRAEPRSAPRQDARPQPAPRREPSIRGEPRGEPRGERSPKPVERH